MSARSWSDAVSLALSVGKKPLDVRQCEGCGGYYVSAMCDNRGGCFLALEMVGVREYRSPGAFDPAANARAAWDSYAASFEVGRFGTTYSITREPIRRWDPRRLLYWWRARRGIE